MNKQTLTITINNIDSRKLEDIWAYAKRESKEDVGVPIERTNHIIVDAESLNEADPDLLGELMAAALTGHVVTTANQIFNDES